ncbi:MAG: hypothetical protein RL180_1251 [Pseudomonadota bacterium]
MKRLNLMHGICCGVVVAAASMTAQTAVAQSVCVFDVMGASGDSYSLIKDFVVVAKGHGVNLELMPYTDESKALRDFQNGKCDATALTDFSTRQFNSYTGSINAIGAVSNNAMAKVALSMMGNPKLADEMIMGNYEVAGVFPMGAAYLVTNDRNVNNLAKVQDKRFAVLESDQAQLKMVKKIGAKPVSVTVSTISTKFNSRQVDIIGAPAMAFGPFELSKGIGTTGAIVRFPVTFVTMNMIVKRDAFPPKLASVGRTWFAGQTSRMMENIQRIEANIPAKYWMDLSNNDKVGYIKLMREMRIDLVEAGVYNKKMTSLLKRIRCKQDPSSFECALTDE